MTQEITLLKTETDLKMLLAEQYQAQIVNYFGDKTKAMKFLSAVISAVQRNPKLLQCEPTTLINSFMIMAQLKLLPSGVSGEAYVIPYNNKGNLEAQFQIGYQGLVTLFYRAGTIEIYSDIIRENDGWEYENGRIKHKVDIFADRGEAKGAYVIVKIGTGGEIHKVMTKDEILTIAKKSPGYFKKDSKTEVGYYTPWNPKNDPELWMWKKTVLKQAGKLVPKNEDIAIAVAEDNKDSNLPDFSKNNQKPNMGNRLTLAQEEAKNLKMGNFNKTKNETLEFIIADENEKWVIYDEKTRKALKTFEKKEEAENWVKIQLQAQTLKK